MYKYEMHQHTSPCSACAGGEPASTVYSLKEQGFSGMVLTNHFRNGNTGIERTLPWEEFVKHYEDDYLIAKKAAEEVDFDVIFGVEEHIGENKEVLLYGITPEFLYSHPEIQTGNLATIYKAAHEFGALVFQAHPFRNRPGMMNPHKPIPVEYIDGMEIYNACNAEEDNLLAVVYAREHNLLTCVGSDAHCEVLDRNRYYLDSDERIKTPGKLVEILKSGKYKLVHE